MYNRNVLEDPIQEWERRKTRNNMRAIQWQKDNPRQAKMYQLKVRAKQAGATILEDVYHDEVYKRGKGICGICNTYVAEEVFCIDHKVTISKGGQHTYENTQPSHRACNSRKYNKIISEPH